MAKRKKKYYKAKFKGVRYVAQMLRKYFKGRYANYAAALPRAREIHAQLLSEGVKVSLAGIMSKERKKRASRPEIKLPDKLLQAKSYFELQDYPKLIAQSDNRITFVSKLFPLGSPAVIGGAKPDYHAYFAPYVNYINSMVSLMDESAYETDWLVMCTPLKPTAKGYETEIISVDCHGSPTDYGYDNDNPNEKAGEVIANCVPKAEAPKPVEGPAPEILPSGSGVTAADIEFAKIKVQQTLADTEQIRQENIANLMKMGLTKAELREWVEILKLNK